MIKNLGLDLSKKNIFKDEEEKERYIILAKKLIKQKIRVDNISENDINNISIKTEFLDNLEKKLKMINKKTIIETEENTLIKEKVFEDNFDDYAFNNNLVMDNLITELEKYNENMKEKIKNTNKNRYIEQQKFGKEITMTKNKIEDALKLKNLENLQE